MARSKVVVICGDPVLTTRLRAVLESRPALEVLSLREFETVFGVAQAPGLDLLVTCMGTGCGLHDVARLLRASESGARAVPVLAVSDRYRVTDATTLFRLGASDYLSLADHSAKLPEVLDALLEAAPNVPAVRPRAQPVGRRVHRWLRSVLAH